MPHSVEVNRAARIGANIARARQRRGLTLDGLAELSCVSRATISALERGHGNPGVQTLWSLADALGLNFAALLGDEPASALVEDAGVSVRLVERQTTPPVIETYILELPAGESRQAKPHLPGVLEHVVVLAGEMRTGPAARPQTLRAGQSMSFAADVDHIYAAGNAACRALVSVVYPEITPGTPDHDLPWPAGGPDWDAVTAILSRATVEVQNGLGVSVTTFRASPVGRISEEGLDRLRRHVEGLPASPAVRRFLVTSADPAVITLYRGSPMRDLGPRPQGLAGDLGARCWDLARQAVQRRVEGDAARLEDVARAPGTIIEAALAADVLTRAGRPTVPHGINVQAARTGRGASDGRRLLEDRIDVDACEAYDLVHPAHARRALAVAGALPSVEGLRILDVGTGPGLPLAMLRELRPDLSALAVDPSEVAVAQLKRRFASDPNVEIRQASVTDLAPPASPFSCAVSIGALHHLDTAAFLSSIRGQLETGGLLIVADEMLAPFRTRQERQAALIRHHLWYVLDTLVSLPSGSHPGDVALAEKLREDLPMAQALAQGGRTEAAIRKIRALHEELVLVERPVLPSHPLAVFSRFHLLELQALVAGLDDEVDPKTFPARFLALARCCGFELRSHQRLYATDGDGDLDAGAHLFVLEAL
ncbi:methyltransferase domain-containing protein (plasmid) [Cereibacter azotoformans]|uniref:methyltransferase domain-containing protein n=1 Tax=Cereibacter azotoformans TaxID=43057 RepID=UPI003B215058